MIRSLRSIQSFIFLLAAGLFLASCGGGGDSGGGGGTAAATITSISPRGIVQSTSRNIAITGTNFTSSLTLSYTSSSGTVSITPTSIASNLITINNFTITTAPTEKYVTINIKSGSTTVASTILGVASVSKTLANDIQTIFSTYCTGCHGSSGNLSLASGNAASNLIETSSSGCSNRLRVKAGDPRITSSFLIDKLTSTTPCAGSKMTGNPTSIGQAEIDAITEWVAGGAN